METQEFNGKTYYLYKGERYFTKGIKKLHRVVWEYHHGEIPKGYHVHHKDGNSHNNDISNLSLVNQSLHLRYTQKKRVKENPEWFKEFTKKGIEAAKSWHSSKEGIEWHKKHAKKMHFGKKHFGLKKCQECKTEYLAKSGHSRFCSNNCKSKNRRS